MAHIEIPVVLTAGVGSRFADLDGMVGREIPLRMGERSAGHAIVATATIKHGGRQAELNLVIDADDTPELREMVLATASANGWTVKPQDAPTQLAIDETGDR